MSTGGFLLANKLPGRSSFDVIRVLKKVSQEKKIGHAGTLDPFATGLLIIGIGKSYTKRLSEFVNLSKTYSGVFVLGVSTTTLDSYGETVKKNNQVSTTKDALERAAKGFIGDIEQTPPIYSAKKIKGVPSYVLARKGLIPILKPTQVSIYDFQINHIEWAKYPKISFRVHCSKGTYIRTLVQDLAKTLGLEGYLLSLHREKIGDYSVKHACILEDLEPSHLHDQFISH